MSYGPAKLTSRPTPAQGWRKVVAVPAAGCIVAAGLGILGAGPAPGAAQTFADGAAWATQVPDVTVSRVKLSGLDPQVAPSGLVSAQAAATGAKLAVAAKVTAKRAADLVALSASAPFAAGSRALVRVREQGKWGRWIDLGIDEAGLSDPNSANPQSANPQSANPQSRKSADPKGAPTVSAGGTRSGSEPLMTRGATAVQVRLETPNGRAPAGFSLELIAAPSSAADTRLSELATVAAARGVRASSITSGTVRAATNQAPTILSRAQWGADESWRRRAPLYTGNLQIGFVHHTQTTSLYTPDEVPRMLRAIYAYHVKSKGHSDIDYNFLVDRFGRLWEGRAGGVDQPVLGGHTAGFNRNSFAVSALGNFHTYSPPEAEMQAISDAIARLFAWKLGMYGVRATDIASVVSEGFPRKIRYAKGVTAQLPAMSSHQTVNYTDCPGRYLQARMDAIRELAATYANTLLTKPIPDMPSFQSGSRSSVQITATATTTLGWRMDIVSPCSDSPVRSFSGQIEGAGPVQVSWDLRDTSGQPVLPGSYLLELRATTPSGTNIPAITGLMNITPAPGGTWGPCANVTRISGESASATSVLVGADAASTAPVVLTGVATASANALAAGITAAPLARKLGGRLLVTPADALPEGVRADLLARPPASVIVVGGVDVVSDAVVADLSGAGFTVTRVAGTSPAESAAAVAAQFSGVGGAVIVDPVSNPGQALAAAALAAAQKVPVLLAGQGEVPAATLTALGAIGSGTLTVVAGDELPDSILAAGLSGRAYVRVSGADVRSGAVAVAAAFPSQSTTAWLMPQAPTSWGALPALAATGTPILFTAPEAFSTEPANYISGRGGLRETQLKEIRSVASVVELSDALLGTASRILLGLPTVAPSGEPVPAPTVAAPAAPPPTATTTRRVGRANASPEPVKRGATVTVRSAVGALFSDSQWRAAPAGVPFSVQFRASGKRTWSTPVTGVTGAGEAAAKAVASKSGYWRIKVGTLYSVSDYVRVKR